MEDSDFSYEDMGASDTFIEDFISKKLGSEQKEGYDCYKIEMLKKRSWIRLFPFNSMGY